MVLGPWDHFTYVNIVPTTAGSMNFGPAGVAGPVISEPMALNWFDRWLRDEPETSETKPGVRWFATGTGEWRESEHWPPEAEDLDLYLTAGGGLSETAPGREASSSYRYDPADPTPTVGGRLLMPTVAAPGIQDLAQVAEREDTLVFDGPEITGPLHIAGPVKLTMWAVTDVEDTDFSAVLVDVHPDGRRLIVADGFVRCRHRNGLDREEWLVPGEPFQIEVDLWDVAWGFDTGHRVGLHLASASFPRFDRSLNGRVSSKDGDLSDAAVANIQILHHPDKPASLRLPRGES